MLMLRQVPGAHDAHGEQPRDPSAAAIYKHL